MLASGTGNLGWSLTRPNLICCEAWWLCSNKRNFNVQSTRIVRLRKILLSNNCVTRWQVSFGTRKQKWHLKVWKWVPFLSNALKNLRLRSHRMWRIFDRLKFLAFTRKHANRTNKWNYRGQILTGTVEDLTGALLTLLRRVSFCTARRRGYISVVIQLGDAYFALCAWAGV